ncbi:hypothetical protein D9M71_839100 [compost metagenome]
MSALRPLDGNALAATAGSGARCDGVTGGLLPGAALLAGAAAAAPSASRITTTSPSDNLSSSLTLISLTTPAAEDGTSSVALSDSSVSRPWSFFTVSPTATRISITGTLL